MNQRTAIGSFFVLGLVLVACGSSRNDIRTDAATADLGRDSGSDAGIVMDLGHDSGSDVDAGLGSFESHGSCTYMQPPTNVLICFQMPGIITEEDAPGQCDTPGHTFAPRCSTENIFGACFYPTHAWYFYTPATEEQRAEALGSCGGGTWVDY